MATLLRDNTIIVYQCQQQAGVSAHSSHFSVLVTSLTWITRSRVAMYNTLVTKNMSIGRQDDTESTDDVQMDGQVTTCDGVE